MPNHPDHGTNLHPPHARGGMCRPTRRSDRAGHGEAGATSDGRSDRGSVRKGRPPKGRLSRHEKGRTGWLDRAAPTGPHHRSYAPSSMRCCVTELSRGNSMQPETWLRIMVSCQHSSPRKAGGKRFESQNAEVAVECKHAIHTYPLHHCGTKSVVEAQRVLGVSLKQV